ncbi:coiled-coil domain containing 43 [Columba livia]|uniref:Coiled-coil domain containing 43 n=1 Tax=Columba livia TaxID=8932 RepID=A0A2I0LNW8_COLLI|nr:coiled-coil domain containing 43 [Columba livia]
MVLPIVTYYSSNGSRKKAIVEKEALDITQCGRVLCSEQNTVQQNEVEREQLGQGAMGQEDKGLSHLKSRPLNKPEEDLLSDVCRELVEKWSESQVVDAVEKKEDEIQALTSVMEKQARIVVKPREVSQEEKQRKAALLAQYANVTDEEDGEDEQDGSTATAVNIGSEKSLFRNTNVEDVLNARKLERELLRDEFQKKKEQDKLQREKDKLAKQERKEKEKKRTQKGERKR